MTSPNKTLVYIAMFTLACVWAFDYVVAKTALQVFTPLSLVFFKYLLGLCVVFTVKCLRDRHFPFSLRDLPLFLSCSLCGEILAFSCEYRAIIFLPVSLVTIILAFVPVISILVERVLYMKRLSAPLVLSVLVCTGGVFMVVGADLHLLFEGRLLGYLLAFGAVLAWNIYNFLTVGLTRRYSAVTLTMYQLICTCLLTLPAMLMNLPDSSAITTAVILEVVYLGVVSAGAGFLVYVWSIGIIGATPCALFSNITPVAATILGWLLLDEMIGPVQIVGGIAVIAAGSAALLLKERQEQLPAATPPPS